MSSDPASLLDELADLRDARDRMIEEKEGIIRRNQPKWWTEFLSDLDAEYGPRLAHVNERIAGVEREIKIQVELSGETATGSRLKAIFRRGATTWDTPALDGYAAAHPEIAQFRKTGKPSVVIQEIK